MMWRLRASRDERLLFMGIRIRSLPPRKPIDSTDFGSTEYITPSNLKTCHSNLKIACHCNQDANANPTCVSSTKIIMIA